MSTHDEGNILALHDIKHFENPRFSINAEGEIVVTVHHNDKADENIAAIITLGKWDTLAADIADRGINQEYWYDNRTAAIAHRDKLQKLKRIRKALGFTY